MRSHSRHTPCARAPVVTASIDQMTFLHPVHLGELVRLKSQVNRVFRTSMEVGVKVWVENLQTGDITHTSSAYLTFVAVDTAGNRVVLTPITPETEEDKRRYDEAAERRAYRLAMKSALACQLTSRSCEMKPDLATPAPLYTCT